MAILEEEPEEIIINPNIHEICTQLEKDYPTLDPMLRLVEEDAANLGIINNSELLSYIATIFACAEIPISQEEIDAEFQKLKI